MYAFTYWLQHVPIGYREEEGTKRKTEGEGEENAVLVTIQDPT